MCSFVSLRSVCRRWHRMFKMCLSQQRSGKQIPAGRNFTSQGTVGEIYHRKNGWRLETRWKCQGRCQGDAAFYRGSVLFYCQQSKVKDSVNQTSIFIENDTVLWITFFENLLCEEAVQTNSRWITLFITSFNIKILVKEELNKFGFHYSSVLFRCCIVLALNSVSMQLIMKCVNESTKISIKDLVAQYFTHCLSAVWCFENVINYYTTLFI